MSDAAASVAEMRWGVRCLCAASLAMGTALIGRHRRRLRQWAASSSTARRWSNGLVHVRPCRRRRLSGRVIPVGTLVPVGAGAVSLGLFAVLVGLLSVLLDVAPAEVGLLVMQPSCPVVCLGRPAACLGGLVLLLLYVSVGSLLELRRAAHVLGRITVHRVRAAA